MTLQYSTENKISEMWGVHLFTSAVLWQAGRLGFAVLFVLLQPSKCNGMLITVCFHHFSKAILHFYLTIPPVWCMNSFPFSLFSYNLLNSCILLHLHELLKSVHWHAHLSCLWQCSIFQTLQHILKVLLSMLRLFVLLNTGCCPFSCQMWESESFSNRSNYSSTSSILFTSVCFFYCHMGWQ